MAWRDTYTDIEVHAWVDLNGNKFTTEFAGIDMFNYMLREGDVDGVLFTAKNPNDTDDTHTYWTYQTEEWDSWDDVLTDIESTLDMYEEMSG